MAVYARKRKNGKYVWYIQFQVDQERFRIPTHARSRVEAEEICSKVKRQVQSGDLPTLPNNNISFREFAGEYIEIKESQGKRSVDNMRQLIARCVEYFDEAPLKAIRPADVDKFTQWLRRERTLWGEPLSTATVNRHLAQLKNLFAEAVKNEYLDKNPTRFSKLKRENNARDRVITPEELERLVDEAAPHLKPIIRLAYYTGMRRGEILGLLWSMVDLDEGFIYLQAEHTKTDQARTVPLNDEMVKVLRKQWKNRQSDLYVFTFKGQQLLEIKRSFNSACRRAGIEDFRFHDLRHTFVTNARKAGVHDFTIMAISGHKTMEMFKRYNTVDKEDLKKGIREMGEATGKA